MNRKREFDDTVAEWVDEGVDKAPERFVWAALEVIDRTPQRGAWRVALENMTMHLKAAAPILGVAAVVVIALAAYQVIGVQNIGDPGPAATPDLVSADDLGGIIVTAANAPEGYTVHRTLTGLEALRASETAPDDSPGFVDALLTDFDRDDNPDNGRYGSFAAIFETVADAELAFDAAVANHESPDGWGLTTDHGIGYLLQVNNGDYDPDPKLGDESVYYIGGRDYSFPEEAIYLWRVDNVILHAVGFLPGNDPCNSSTNSYGEFPESTNCLLPIAEGMDARAKGESSPSATEPASTVGGLEAIVMTGANVPEGLTVHRTLTGLEALRASETAPDDSPGFVDALLTDFDRDDNPDNGRYGSFAAIFETVADAELAFDAAVANHESADGWALTTDRVVPLGYEPDPALGDESRFYVEGMAYGYPELGVYLWRVDNVLLHAVAFYMYWDPDLLRSIAEAMDARAH